MAQPLVLEQSRVDPDRSGWALRGHALRGQGAKGSPSWNAPSFPLRSC